MEEEHTFPNSFYEVSITLMPEKDTTRNKNYRSISLMHKQFSNKSVSKLNSALYKRDNTSQPSVVYLRNARLVQL